MNRAGVSCEYTSGNESRCRMCLMNKALPFGLFDSPKMKEFSNITFWDIFDYICGITTGNDLGLPQRICMHCSMEAKNCYRFILLCKNSDRILQEEINVADLTRDDVPDFIRVSEHFKDHSSVKNNFEGENAGIIENNCKNEDAENDFEDEKLDLIENNLKEEKIDIVENFFKLEDSEETENNFEDGKIDLVENHFKEEKIDIKNYFKHEDAGEIENEDTELYFEDESSKVINSNFESGEQAESSFKTFVKPLDILNNVPNGSLNQKYIKIISPIDLLNDLNSNKLKNSAYKNLSREFSISDDDYSTNNHNNSLQNETTKIRKISDSFDVVIRRVPIPKKTNLSAILQSKPLHECLYCEKTYTTKYSCRMHLMKIHPEKKIGCSHCTENHFHPIAFVEHMMMRHAREKFNCSFCDFSVGVAELYLEHMSESHGEIFTEKNVQYCDFTRDSTTCNKNNTHRPVHGGKIRGRMKFSDLNEQRDRKYLISKRVHCKIMHEHDVSCSRLIYLCQICGRDFLRLHNLNEHIKIHFQ